LNSSAAAITINQVNGSNAITTSNTGGGSITLVTSNTFTITNIVDGSEVRIIKQSDLSELGGAENVGASPSGLSNVTVSSDPDNAGRYVVTFSHGLVSDTPVYVVVHHVDYQFIRPSYTIKAQTLSLQVSQVSDRQYNRGTVFTPG
jgi:hypothetical protein